VATGALRGEGDRGADLGELTAEDLELIASHESVISATRDRANPLGAPGQPLFLWHRPMVFIRQ